MGKWIIENGKMENRKWKRENGKIEKQKMGNRKSIA